MWTRPHHSSAASGGLKPLFIHVPGRSGVLENSQGRLIHVIQRCVQIGVSVERATTKGGRDR
jgi:hypothetical protein